ncbi:transcriptional activator of glycolytic enzymes domain-containing protein [Hirsutella rhossiliensis]|uniref:Transcriptional activator of glycolytic enzymes domain-containing protein n=1 Tax=Hirsutella rhossiliensis TaxID=111463 RepID=A0A9P8N3S6_9HYPO|nr:transcriptional activator of glycolytic enzymes domain-containing protein [Hirsutella rhossiliensis]KAH0964167.1 transcriptional activator of glycolytic enzymes domain-containing protein [Hirsutella rhossiliensis]
MAAGAFLELLEWLREVLLQDAVFLRESYPDHPIFQDPVFSCPEFEAFASKVQDTCTRDHEDSHTTVAAEQLAERRHLDLLGASYELCTKLDEFAQATYTVTFSPGQGAAGQHAEIAGAHQQRRRAPRETELLRLWRQGWGEMPSVDSLERDWGARWRPSAEKNYFSTRKIIVDEVRRRAQSDGLTEDIVARQMDEERGPSSLDKLFKAIRKDRQGEKGTQTPEIDIRDHISASPSPTSSFSERAESFVDAVLAAADDDSAAAAALARAAATAPTAAAAASATLFALTSPLRVTTPSPPPPVTPGPSAPASVSATHHKR